MQRQIEQPEFEVGDRFRLDENGRKGVIVVKTWDQIHQKMLYLVFYDDLPERARLIFDLHTKAAKAI